MKRTGFTLIEILLALAVAAALMLVLVRIFGSASDTALTVNAAATLESELATARATIEQAFNDKPFIAPFYGESAAVGMLYSIDTAKPKQAADLQTSTRVDFDTAPPHSPVAAGVVFNGGPRAALFGVVERDTYVETDCPVGMAWTPATEYHAAGTVELGLGAALKVRYNGDFVDDTLYLRQDQGAWLPVLEGVKSVRFDYLYRDRAGGGATNYPSSGNEPWNTERTSILTPKLAVSDGQELQLTQLVAHVTLERGGTERSATIPLTARPVRPVRYVEACADSISAKGDFILEIAGLPAGNQGAGGPVAVDGPDPSVVGSYRQTKTWRSIDAGVYTITAGPLEINDGGLVRRYVPRKDPDVPHDLARSVTWTTSVNSWAPRRVRVVYEEEPAVLLWSKPVIYVTLPFSWVVPTNVGAGLIGPSGSVNYWYMGNQQPQLGTDFTSRACGDGYPCTGDFGYGVYGSPYPVWGGTETVYARPGTYTATVRDIVQQTTLLKITLIPTFPFGYVVFSPCTNTTVLDEAAGTPRTYSVSSGTSTEIRTDVVCTFLF